MTSEVIASIIVAMTMLVALVAMLATMSVTKARLRRRAYRLEKWRRLAEQLNALQNECPTSNDTHGKGKTP